MSPHPHSLHPPLPSWELNCRLPSRHSCALPSLFSGRPRFSSCHVTRRTRRTEGCGRGCVSSANCCGSVSESRLCARGKSGEECTKSGEWSLLPFSVFSFTYRTSGRRRGDEFRHVRRKLGREEGRKEGQEDTGVRR